MNTCPGPARLVPRAVLLALVMVLAAPHWAAAQAPVAFDPRATDFTPDEFLALFDNALLPGLAPIGPAPSITGNPDLDARIRAIGEARGYRRRPLPAQGLVSVGGHRLQPEAAAGFQALRAAAAAAGHSIQLTSGFRGHESQTSIFRRRLVGTSDSAIDRRLRTVAVPGYSKHHTGYAIDIRISGVGGFALRNTAGYQWLAANNFANAKAHGWIPSYPDGSGPAGPVPEPWELVWVGTTNIVCAEYSPTETAPFCDTRGSTFESDIVWLYEQRLTEGCRPGRYCVGAPITRGQAATLLWRLAGSPPAAAVAPFTDIRDGAFYRDAVGWMYENGLTTGVSPVTFAPDRDLTRAEFVTFAWRYAGSPSPPPDDPFDDVTDASFAEGAVRWAAHVGVTRGITPTSFAPNRVATRGEAAAFVQRLDAAST